MDPRAEWEALESRVEDPIPYLGDPARLHRDYYPRVNSALIARMERLVRAIAMQFTLGGHAAPGGDTQTALRRVPEVQEPPGRPIRHCRLSPFGRDPQGATPTSGSGAPTRRSRHRAGHRLQSARQISVMSGRFATTA